MTAPIFGIYKAIVVNDVDPSMARRLQVVVPAVNVVPLWAQGCVQAPQASQPGVGETVWVIFEAGEVNNPVWVGVLPGGAA